MPKSILDLTFDFIEALYPEEPSQDVKKAVLRAMGEILERGFTDQEVAQAIIRTPFVVTGDPLELFKKQFQRRQPKSENLIKPGQFYYHNQLRIMPGPTKVDIDYNTGEIKRISEPYFLEMRASYTMEDLIGYYCRSLDLRISEAEKARYVGSFKWLLKLANIDMLLFMIDAAVDCIRAEDAAVPSTPAVIADYRDDAERAYNTKMTENKLTGDDKIAPRQRVLSSRRRVLAEERGLCP